MENNITSRHSIPDYFLKWENETPDAPFLRQPTGNTWQEYTWKEAGTAARKVVARLQEMGLAPGSRIGIWSANHAEWIICDLAIMLGGYISVPIYANINAETLKNILLHAECSLLFIGKLLPKDWDTVHPYIPETIKTVTMRGFEKENITRWEDFVSTDAPAKVINTDPDDIQTIIYTSGTTGMPKGVIHSYSTIINAIDNARDIVRLMQPGNRFLSYLPLSHAAERGLVEFGAIYCGGTISFVESLDTFATNIQQVKPTHFFGVPRVWEKFQSRILEKMPQSRLDILLAIPVVSGIIRRKIQATLGLDKAIVIFTGAAPVPVDLLRWFGRLGIHLQEAYGLSEDFNLCAMNPKEDIRVGTVGKIMENQEVKIDPETSEVLQKCNWLMKGYYKEPELTAKALQDGYLYTGDIGEIVADKYLKITGRLKDIFKTAKGEYIAPFNTEMHFLSLKEVDQACLMGSHYPQPFIVLVLSEYGKSISRPELTKVLERALDHCNQGSMGYSQVKKAIIVKEEWTNENNLLTPTLKMKRNVLSQKYEPRLEHVYHLDELVSWEV